MSKRDNTEEDTMSDNTEDLQKQLEKLTTEVATLKGAKNRSVGCDAALKRWRRKGLRSRVQDAKGDEKTSTRHRVEGEESSAAITIEIRNLQASGSNDYSGGEGAVLRAAKVAKLENGRQSRQEGVSRSKAAIEAARAESKRLGKELALLENCSHLDPVFVPFLIFSVSLVGVSLAVGGNAGGAPGVVAGLAFSVVLIAGATLGLRDKLTGADRYDY